MSAPLQDAIRTTCPYCGVGCGVRAVPDGRGGAAIAGDLNIPPISVVYVPRVRRWARRWAWKAACCGRCSASGQGGLGGSARPRCRRARAHARTTGHSVAFYLSGQLLTEDYYVANKLVKGFIGTANVDTNSRLCMASSVAGHRRAFGADVVPGITRIWTRRSGRAGRIECRLVSSRALSPHADGAGERGARVVSIDPRRTATGEGADLHLAIRPAPMPRSSPACWFVSRIKAASTGPTLTRHTMGFGRPSARARAARRRSPRLPRATGLAAGEIASFYALMGGQRARRHAATRRASTSRRRAPTRSTPSSTAIWRRAASAGRAWVRSH